MNIETNETPTVRRAIIRVARGDTSIHTCWVGFGIKWWLLCYGEDNGIGFGGMYELIRTQE